MEIEGLTKRVAIALMDKNYKIATAEECTAGLVGASIASQDYAQRWYKGTTVVYDEATACKVLDVPEYTIKRNDFVSPQVVNQMALSTLYKFDVNVALAITGYVDGYGSTDVPAGDVQICVGTLINGSVQFKYRKLLVRSKDRGKNIEEAIKEALILIMDTIVG
jgi:PncC family amidohydrolase